MNKHKLFLLPIALLLGLALFSCENDDDDDDDEEEVRVLVHIK